MNKLEELRYIFKESKPLINEHQINMVLRIGQEIRKKIETGEWKSLPDYESFLHPFITADVSVATRRHLYVYLDAMRKKYKVKW